MIQCGFFQQMWPAPRRSGAAMGDDAIDLFLGKPVFSARSSTHGADTESGGVGYWRSRSCFAEAPAGRPQVQVVEERDVAVSR